MSDIRIFLELPIILFRVFFDLPWVFWLSVFTLVVIVWIDKKRKAEVDEYAPETRARKIDTRTSNNFNSHISPPNSTPRSPPKSQKRKPARPPTAPTPPMPPTNPLPLLICSVGNPGSAYKHTLHSAGHTVLGALQQHLRYPAFQKVRVWGGGMVSAPPPTGSGGGVGGGWTLWQSTSLMNVSGKGVVGAYNTWLDTLPAREEESGQGGGNGDGGARRGRLVVLHDELEKPLGAVNLNVRQGASARGHNGLKSIAQAMGGREWVRIGVGIGRPVSRESRDVASYVLRKMEGRERELVEGCVPGVVEALRVLERG